MTAAVAPEPWTKINPMRNTSQGKPVLLRLLVLLSTGLAHLGPESYVQLKVSNLLCEIFHATDISPRIMGTRYTILLEHFRVT